MAADRIVVDDDGSDGAGPAFRPSWWLIAAGLVVVAVVVLSSRPGGSGTDVSTTTMVSVPSVDVPPTLPPGMVVGETLRWERTPGLGEATYIGGVVAFDDAYWVIGRIGADLVAWRSGDPALGWARAAVIAEDLPDWSVADVGVAEGRLLVAASAESSFGAVGAVYESGDGREWVRHDLFTGDPGRPSGVVEEIIPVEGGLVMTGRAHSRRPPGTTLDRFPAQARELVLEGNASLAMDGATLRVIVPPGLSVAQVPDEGAGGGQSTAVPDAGEPYLWWGNGPGDMQADPRADQPIPFSTASTPDGRLAGQTGIRLAFSEDGRSWEPTGPFFGTIAGFVPWNEGFVLTVRGGEPVFWAEGAAEPIPLLPEGLESTASISSVAPAVGEWGLALATGGGTDGGSLVVPEPTRVAEHDGAALYLINPILLEMRRGDRPVWTDSVGQVPVSLKPDGRLRFGPEPDSISVSIDDWLETLYRTSGGGRPADTSGVVHTLNGERWSHSTWEAISGAETVVGLSLFGTDEFLLVVDQTSFPDWRVNGVALGLPLARTAPPAVP